MAGMNLRPPRVLLAALCLALSSMAASAPPASAADLLEAFRLAQSHDAQFAAARAQWQAAQERLPQARAGTLPVASVTAALNRHETDTTFTDLPPGFISPLFVGGRRGFETGNLTLQLVHPLYRPQNAIAVEQARAQLALSDAQLAQAGQDLILRVAQSYFDVLSAQDTLELIAAQKRAIAEQLAQAKRNFELGSATIVDYNEAQARFDLVSAQEIAAHSEIEVRRRALEQIIGRLPAELRRLPEAVRLAPPQPTVIDRWVELAVERGLPVQLQQAALDSAERELDRQRAARQPTLDLVGLAGHSRTTGSATSPIGIVTNQIVLGVQLNLPLYTGGLIDARVRELAATRGRVLQELEHARRASALAARQAYLGVVSGIAQMRALEAALASSRLSLDSTLLGQKVGVRTQVDVLNAQQLYFGARRDLASARYQTLLSMLRLEAAVGALGEEDLDAINRLLGG
jgi:outer membrane protein